MNIQRVPKQEAFTLLQQAARALDMPDSATRRWEKDFLGLGRLYGRFGVDYWSLTRDGHVVALACLAPQKRRHPVWGRAVTSHWGWTSPRLRGQGFGVALHRRVLDHYRQQGCDRWASQTKSWSGFRLQLRLGCTFWGPQNDGRVMQETSFTQPQPPGVPPGAARRGLGPDPMTHQQLVRILADPHGHYHVPYSQVTALLLP